MEFAKHEASLHEPWLTFLLDFIDTLYSLVESNVREDKYHSFELSGETCIGFHLFKSRREVFQKGFNFISWIFVCVDNTEIKCIFSERNRDEGADRSFASNIRVLFTQEVPDEIVNHSILISVESLLPLV